LRERVKAFLALAHQTATRGLISAYCGGRCFGVLPDIDSKKHRNVKHDGHMFQNTSVSGKIKELICGLKIIPPEIAIENLQL